MTLHDLNTLPKQQLTEELSKCCGSRAWVDKMLPFFPADDLVELLEDAEEQWWKCSEQDWKEAFAQHPKIGDREVLRQKFASGMEKKEQAGMDQASQAMLDSFADANRRYEEKFGYIFIVCATGRSAGEMLGDLQTRLQNSPEVEIEIAADEQNKITKLRLENLLE